MPKTAQPDLMLVAFVAAELADLVRHATHEALSRHLETILAARDTWRGFYLANAREHEVAARRAVSKGVREKQLRLASRAKARGEGASKARAGCLPKSTRFGLESAFGKPIVRLYDLYAFDRLHEVTVNRTAPWLSSSRRNLELEVLLDGVSDVIAGCRVFEERVAALAPESAYPANQAAGLFSPEPRFADTALKASRAALPQFTRVADTLRRAIDQERVNAHRPPDRTSRLMALRVVATAWVAGDDDADGIEALVRVHAAVREALSELHSEHVVKDPVAQAKVDLSAFMAVRERYAPDRIRAGLTREDVAVALAPASRRRLQKGRRGAEVA